MRTLFISLIFLLIQSSMFTLSAQEIESFLIPTPKKAEISDTPGIHQESRNILKTIIVPLFKNTSFDFSATVNVKNTDSLAVHLKLEIDSVNLKPQQYLLNISENSILIKGQNKAALYYGKQTLYQIIEYAETRKCPIPTVNISDYPDFERRGLMIDISRDKVPTMTTLFNLIDLMAQWKTNEIQLYTEHTFAYKNHKTVWEDASPITPEEIKQLQEYCKERFIDLVPNQNSFGHMEKWLEHDEYLHLAECPDDCNTVWGARKRTSLDPTNPESLKLMQELYAELLPNFSSKYFNIGGDETVELGLGRSKPEVDKKGIGRVYLDYLVQLNEAANKNGKEAQFWGDIILNHPELISELPKNMTALVWGYDAEYPFEKNLPQFKDAGIEYYVCPGTSSWRSLIGRNSNAFTNLKRAAIYGKANNAKGYLNTNWGDYGHWQPLSVSYAPLMVGASYAWNSEANPETNLEFQLSQYVFKDSTAQMAKAVLKLGDAYLKTNIPNGNANAFHLMLHRYKWTMQGNYQTKLINEAGLKDAEAAIDAALKILEVSRPQAKDSTILKSELIQAAKLAKHGIHLGLARLNAKDLSTANIDPETKRFLSEELTALIRSQKECWILRNRPGGMEHSISLLEEILDYYTN